MPELRLGNGIHVEVPLIVRGYGQGQVEGLDFSEFPVCDSCGGHSDRDGKPIGGYIEVDVSRETIPYRTLAACPRCVYGAFRSQCQNYPFPAEVRVAKPGETLSRSGRRRMPEEMPPEPDPVLQYKEDDEEVYFP